MTTFLQKHLAVHDGTLRFNYFKIFFFTSAFASLLYFLKLRRFSGNTPLPCLCLLSVWTRSPGGIVGVGVLSGLIAVWCLVVRRAWLGRRWGKTSCPHSLLSLSHLFSVSPASFFLSPTLYIATQDDGRPARLINWQRERETDRHKRMGKEERAAHRLLKHRFPRCSPGVCWLHQRL